MQSEKDKIQQLHGQLEKAITYGAETGSLDKHNLIATADVVCVFGLGT